MILLQTTAALGISILKLRLSGNDLPAAFAAAPPLGNGRSRVIRLFPLSPGITGHGEPAEYLADIILRRRVG